MTAETRSTPRSSDAPAGIRLVAMNGSRSVGSLGGSPPPEPQADWRAVLLKARAALHTTHPELCEEINAVLAKARGTVPGLR